MVFKDDGVKYTITLGEKLGRTHPREISWVRIHDEEEVVYVFNYITPKRPSKVTDEEHFNEDMAFP